MVIMQRRREHVASRHTAA